MTMTTLITDPSTHKTDEFTTAHFRKDTSSSDQQTSSSTTVMDGMTKVVGEVQMTMTNLIRETSTPKTDEFTTAHFRKDRHFSKTPTSNMYPTEIVTSTEQFKTSHKKFDLFHFANSSSM